MRTLITLATVGLLLIVGLLSGSRSTSGQGSPPAPKDKFYESDSPVPNQYLAMLQDYLEGEELSTTANALAQQYGGQVLQSPYEAGVNGFSVQMTEENALALSEDARVQYVQEIPASGFPHSGTRTNVALASNGGQAFASSTLNSSFPVSAIINGDRRGAGWGSGTGGWSDATPDTFPDYLEIHFNGEKRVNAVDLITVQDNYSNPAEPTAEMTFAQYGVTAFRLSYWDSATGQWEILREVQGNNLVQRRVEFPTVVTPKLSIIILNGPNHYSRVVEIEAWEAPASTNVALAANGGQAFASSTLSSAFPASAIINGDRSGTGWAAGPGGWHDATGNNFPDYLEVHFDGEKRINEIDFFTLQDNFNEPVDPSADMTFSQYGVTAFRINYWNSATAQWVMLTEIQDNSLVWRKVEFPTIKTQKLSIIILNGATGHSRVVEIEAWEAPAPINVALPENGGIAFASSTLNDSYPVSGLINGDRKGSGWGAGTGGWHDATGNSFPDYLELHFSGDKMIHEINFITVQDNFANPVLPTLETTFAQYGVTAFRVNYWNSATSQWVMLKEIQGNNKVWRKIEFDPVQTSKLSIMILNGAANYSRVVEIEVMGTAIDPEPQPQTEPYEPGPTPDSTSDPSKIGGVTPATGYPSPSPTQNLRVTTDHRYFIYGNDNRTIALVGNSGSYLPHVARLRTKNSYYDPVFENCTYDAITGAEFKYRQCIDQIKTSGLNHTQVWVFLNHSVGMLSKEGPSPRSSPAVFGKPYTHEQPFFRNDDDTKWRLNIDGNAGFNSEFFTRLRKVIEYCQEKGIIVGVVLFDPGSGKVQGLPKLSPWYAPNNTSNKGFSDDKYFTSADNADTNVNGDPPTATDPKPIDTNSTNKDLRKLQITLMKKTALELKNLKNFYWVLANEPDLGGVPAGQPVITWHRYMSKILRQYENQINGNKPHLIAANVSTNPAVVAGKPGDVITKMTKEGAIDIITSHYVQLSGGAGPVTAQDRYGAMKLVRTFNTYDSNGNATADNTKLWGFSEDRPSGVRNWDPWNSTTNFRLWDDPWTAAAVRVEAWEFLMNGGGLFDHLSYRWGNYQVGNPPFSWNSGNEPQAIMARDQLGYLSKFMETLKLNGMKRMMPGTANAWINQPTNYGALSYWSAMSRPRLGTNDETFLFYFHRSTLVSALVKYEPFHADNTTTTVTVKVQKLPFIGCYQADWYYPSGETIDNVAGSSGGMLIPVRNFPFYFAGGATINNLVSPPYKQDVLLKITWLKNGPPC